VTLSEIMTGGGGSKGNVYFIEAEKAILVYFG